MAEVKRVERPLSPHLSIWHWQIHAITSILTRITGNGLIISALLSVWWLLAAATSDSQFAIANAVVTSWFGDLAFTASAWALWFHYLAGLRHLYFDAGHGLDMKTAEKLSWAVVIGSFVLTILTIFIV
ncbi:MAG: sdhC [Cypionkella sp.]|uniref:succinate dehydrogenase, cytochrome b556 subunit n=1 Tax=Cypionkella sp. TaxID=2811411 RepID=UPI00260E7742|nr:succinate dehydrogenase, cytochrome b556 subunit [Cypionkella sp.]MDB5660224.1 sdhC [Cypionkella sp.]MDB5664681.1 sdhC [Cypionkella sp.]